MKIKIDAGRYERQNVPVSIPSGELKEGQTFLLEPGGIPAQVAGRELKFIMGYAGAGSQVEFSGSPLKNTPPGLALADADDTLTFSGDHGVITQYHFGERSKQPIPAKPYFYPVILNGLAMTRHVAAKSEPKQKIDHPHHRSLWVAHGAVNGADIWADEESEGQMGFQRHLEFTRKFSGPVCAGFTELLDWESAKREKLMHEERSFTVWKPFPSGMFLDLCVTLKADYGPVDLGDTKEGGICSVRVRESMQGSAQGLITNSLGAVQGECWGMSSSWCDYSGPVENRKAGIAIFDHPKSFRYPTYWHVREYGLFTANPFALSDYGSAWSANGGHRIEKGDAITFRYRIYLHEGDSVGARVAERWLDFALAPAAKTV